MLVGKLIYPSLTSLDISYAVGVVSQFMHSPATRHLAATYQVVWGIGILYRKQGNLRVETF